jgi:hypothetical protein
MPAYSSSRIDRLFTDEDQVLSHARELLSQVSNFDLLNQEKLLGILSTLMATPYPECMNKFRDAATLCYRATYFNLGKDPIIEEWASWSKRYDWLRAELSAGELSISGRELEPSLITVLNNFRKFYQDDGEGYPKEIWAIYDRIQLRKDTAQARTSLYQFAAIIESREAEMGVSSDNVEGYTKEALAECNIRDSLIEVDLLCSQMRASARENQGAIAIKFYQNVLRQLSSPQLGTPFEALQGKGHEVVNSFFDHVSISIHQSVKDLKESFWSEIDAAQQGFHSRSNSYPLFSPDELRHLLQEKRMEIVQIRFKGDFVSAGFLIQSGAKFLSRTKDKLVQFSDITLSELDVHCWQYLNVADLNSLLKYRELKIDWSLVLKDTITDIALASNREDVLGIVESGNPAVRSHQRLGFEALASEITFLSDSGQPGKVFRRSLFSLDSE